MNIEKEYVEGLLRKIERLQAERDCHHAWQDKACKLLERVSDSDLLAVDPKLHYSIDDFLDETPQQCLRDVQAEAIKDFVDFNKGRFTNAFDMYISEALEAYIAKMRQGGAE